MTSGSGQRSAAAEFPGVPQQASPVGADRVRSSPGGGHATGDYSRARAAEDDHAQWERVHAARTVACNARGAQDLRLLLSILGLDGADHRGDPEAGPGAIR